MLSIDLLIYLCLIESGIMDVFHYFSDDMF